MLQLKIFQNQVVACSAVGGRTELYIVHGVCRIASDDGLIAVNIDASVRTVVASGGVLLQRGDTEICCDYDGVGRV